MIGSARVHQDEAIRAGMAACRIALVRAEFTGSAAADVAIVGWDANGSPVAEVVATYEIVAPGCEKAARVAAGK